MLEGVAYGLRDSLDLVRAPRRRGRGRPCLGRRLAGQAVAEIISSVLDLPLETTAAEEGSAYGAALLGGVAGGVFADVHDAVARCVRVGGTVEPDPAWVAAYAERRARFISLYPALEGAPTMTEKEITWQ